MKFIIVVILLALFVSCDIKKNQDSEPERIEEVILTNEPTGENVIPHRDQKRYAWQKPQLVIDRLGDIDEKVVADIGAGTGYFSFRLVKKSKRVIAVDIDQNMIDLMDLFIDNLDTSEQEKIETRLASSDDPNLKEQEVDVAIIINTIGYINDRTDYLNRLRTSLKPGGLLFIVDFKMKRIPDDIAPSAQYRVNILDLEHDLIESGYSALSVDDISLDYQYIIKAYNLSEH